MKWITDKDPDKNGLYLVTIEWIAENRAFCTAVTVTPFSATPSTWIGSKIDKPTKFQCEAFDMKVLAWMEMPKPYAQ